MQLDNFFAHFCVNDDEQALLNLYAFKDANYPLLRICLYPFLKTATDAALTEADIIQEVIIHFWENREEICRKNHKNTTKNPPVFTYYFVQALKNKCIDYERKNQHKFKPKKISEREKNELLWTLNYSQNKENELVRTGELNLLELESLTIFALHQVSDHLKLLVVLNILASYKKELVVEIKNKEWLFGQLSLPDSLNQYTPVDIYKMKSKDLKILLKLEEKLVKRLSNEIRKFKQQLKRKLNRKSLWKDIQRHQ